MKVPLTDKGQMALIARKLELNVSKTLHKFIVEDCYLTAADDEKTLLLKLELHRLSGPFWMSLFIPSICLIVAAEIALFVDESQFQATIMVSLTSNLVMYTLYSAIQEKLPEDSSYKLIDYWLLHGLVMPMVVFIVLAINELANSRLAWLKPMPKEITVADIANIQTHATVHDDYSPIDKFHISMLVCKVMVPVVSLIFMLTFFSVIYHDR